MKASWRMSACAASPPLIFMLSIAAFPQIKGSVVYK